MSARVLSGTPAEHGYRFPPEWAPHSGTLLSWPRPSGISFPGRYETVPPALARIISAITPRETVYINVPDEPYERLVREQLSAGGASTQNVRFFHIPTNECWCRDHGPAFVLRDGPAGREAAVVDWGFNAWGGKYPPFDADDAVPTRMAEMLGLPVFEVPVVMEGGSVDFNGAGCILTTRDCLLNPNRNAGLSPTDIERYLRSYYGQQKVLWLEGGIAGDDTDGHVDDLARFVDQRTIVVGVEDDPSDENHAVTRDAFEQCAALRDADGKPFQVVPIPMPSPVVIEDQRCPATYVNFYFVNGALLVPIYGDRDRDGRAMAALQRLVPEREVVGIDCRDLIWGLGAIHCLTQQMPAW